MTNQLYGTFLLDISQFTRFPNIATEITVTHLCGKPMQITMDYFVTRILTGSAELTEYIEAAAKNNYESIKSETLTT